MKYVFRVVYAAIVGMSAIAAQDGPEDGRYGQKPVTNGLKFVMYLNLERVWEKWGNTSSYEWHVACPSLRDKRSCRRHRGRNWFGYADANRHFAAGVAGGFERCVRGFHWREYRF